MADGSAPLGDLYVGTAGYSYAHWRGGVFYPKGLPHDRELNHYSQHFPTTEINTTFYGVPSEQTIKSWKTAVQGREGFLFALKARKSVTHESGLSPDILEKELPFFWERARLLQYVGPILFQFPPSFSKDLEALQRLEPFLPADFSYAFEFRHDSWRSEDVYEFMRQRNWSLVMHALPDRGMQEVEQVTARWVYLRLHGKQAEHAWNYSEDELRPYVDKVTRWRREGLTCFIFFLNDADGRAPENAWSFLTVARACAGEPSPKKPEEKMQIKNFFKTTGASVSTSKKRKAEVEASEGSDNDLKERAEGAVTSKGSSDTTCTDSEPQSVKQRPRPDEQKANVLGSGDVKSGKTAECPPPETTRKGPTADERKTSARAGVTRPAKTAKGQPIRSLPITKFFKPSTDSTED